MQYLTSAPHRILDDALTRFIRDVEAGIARNLMIFMPPRVGKSYIVSEHLPAFVLGRHPEWEVLAASATQDLANFFGRRVRAIVNDPAYLDLFPRAILSGDSNAADEFTLAQGGAYKAVGVGSQVVGRGAHVAIIDDPIKNREMAASAHQRDLLYDWYTSSLITRLYPGGGKILMHQRWHPDDLAGRLLAAARENPEADQWEVISLPALDELGESCFPERFSTAHYRRLRASMPARDWLSMYQQSPVLDSGDFFRAEQFKWSLPPTDGRPMRWVIGADFAVSTATYADNTAAFALGLDSQDNLYVAPDFVYGRYAPRDSVQRVLNLARKYNAALIATDKGPLDAALADTFARTMREMSYFVGLKRIHRASAKHIMAAPYQARCEQGLVHLPSSEFFRTTFVPQHINFVPDADGADDCIDAMTNGVHALRGASKPAPPAQRVEEAADPWDEIMRGAQQARGPTTFTRLNGEPYAKRPQPTR